MSRVLPRKPLADRFWPKVDKAGPGGCWLWTASLNTNGYGQINSGGRGRPLLAHRVAYELVIGPIPDGLPLDHLCRVHSCVNPAHLEPVTNRENWVRGESPSAVAYVAGTCARGHGPEHHSRKSPRMVCLACKRMRRARAKAAA